MAQSLKNILIGLLVGIPMFTYTAVIVYLSQILYLPDEAMVILVVTGIVGIFVTYRIIAAKITGNKTWQQAAGFELERIKTWCRKIIIDIFATTKALIRVATKLIKILLILGAVGLGIWLIIALGPLWIIAILLLLILLILGRR